jgi:hypothetical protein
LGIVEFNYTNHAGTVHSIEPLIGKKGVLKAVSVVVKSLETEEYIKIAGILEDGSVVPEDALKRLFNLPSRLRGEGTVSEEMISNAGAEVERSVKVIEKRVGERNAVFFQDELEKLDLWGDDQRASLKATLKEFDDEIKELKKQSRLAPNLPEKLEIEKKRRVIEKRREDAWKNYDNAKEEIEKKKDGLIDQIEARLKQTISVIDLFTIRWQVI